MERAEGVGLKVSGSFTWSFGLVGGGWGTAAGFRTLEMGLGEAWNWERRVVHRAHQVANTECNGHKKVDKGHHAERNPQLIEQKGCFAKERRRLRAFSENEPEFLATLISTGRTYRSRSCTGQGSVSSVTKVV